LHKEELVFRLYRKFAASLNLDELDGEIDNVRAKVQEWQSKLTILEEIRIEKLPPDHGHGA
jgi:hypothetical protein